MTGAQVGDDGCKVDGILQPLSYPRLQHPQRHALPSMQHTVSASAA